MYSENMKSKIDITELIKSISNYSSEPRKENKPKLSYIQNYFNSSHRERIGLNRSNQFREAYNHLDTLKFRDASFSFKKIVDQDMKIHKIPSPKAENTLKEPMGSEKDQKKILVNQHFLITPETELVQSRDFLKNKSKIRKALNKSTRIRYLPKHDSAAITPDILKINRLLCSSFEHVKPALVSVKNLESAKQRIRSSWIVRKKQLVVDIDQSLNTNSFEVSGKNESRLLDVISNV